MEINVKGSGSIKIAPDQVRLYLSFDYKAMSYEDALNQGTNNVNVFVNQILIPNGFTIEDMKTTRFVIANNTEYNESTRKYVHVGYRFEQASMIKFDYDKEKMASLMEQISKLDNPPIYNVSFGVKDEESARKDLLAKAYDDAKTKAEAIAAAAGKTIVECVKVNFKSDDLEYTSKTGFYSREMAIGSKDGLMDTFTPEDIELTENLYCLFITN